MQQADCLLVSMGLWPFCLLGTVVETGRGNGSGLLFSGEVVMEGDRGMEGREPTPCSGERPGHGGEGSPPPALERDQGMEGKGAHPLFCSTGSSDATSHLSCHHIPRLEQGRRRVITPPMTDRVMESELHNIFLCDCYILLSRSSS